MECSARLPGKPTCNYSMYYKISQLGKMRYMRQAATVIINYYAFLITYDMAAKKI